MPARDVRAGARAVGAFAALVRAFDFALERFGLFERDARFAVARSGDANAARARAPRAATGRRRRRGASEILHFHSLRLLDQWLHRRANTFAKSFGGWKVPNCPKASGNAGRGGTWNTWTYSARRGWLERSQAQPGRQCFTTEDHAHRPKRAGVCRAQRSLRPTAREGIVLLEVHCPSSAIPHYFSLSNR